MKNIIFDIDGTLWDSTDVVAESWNEAIWEKAGIKANLDGDKLKKLFGKTMDEIGRLMLPTLDDEKRAEVCQACYDYEDAYLEKHSGVFYDGVIDTLNEVDISVISDVEKSLTKEENILLLELLSKIEKNFSSSSK